MDISVNEAAAAFLPTIVTWASSREILGAALGHGPELVPTLTAMPHTSTIYQTTSHSLATSSEKTNIHLSLATLRTRIAKSRRREERYGRSTECGGREFTARYEEVTDNFSPHMFIRRMCFVGQSRSWTFCATTNNRHCSQTRMIVGIEECKSTQQLQSRVSIRHSLNKK